MPVKTTSKRVTLGDSSFTCGKGQTYVLEAVVASFIVLGAVFFMIKSLPSQGSKVAAFSDLQLKKYADDILEILSVEDPVKLKSEVDTGNHTSLLYECVKQGVELNNWTEFDETFSSVGKSLENLSIMYNAEVLEVSGNRLKVLHSCGNRVSSDAESSFRVVIVDGGVYEVKLSLWYV